MDHFEDQNISENPNARRDAKTPSPPDDLGKKVFFLYPHNIIQEDLINEILREEYEVYFVKDHLKAVRIFKKYPNSILFINIDTVMPEPKWDAYIKSLVTDSGLKSFKIGVISYNEDENIRSKYIQKIGLPCGYIKLKAGVKETKDLLLKTLIINDAKGRRKYVRARCENDVNAKFNVKIYDKLLTGDILDISSVGMACRFDTNIDMPINTSFSDIQLKLKGSLVTVSGKILGVRKNEYDRTYVILFDPSMPHFIKDKIFSYIFKYLQSNLETEMKTV